MSEREKPWWETDVGRVLSETEIFYSRVAELHPDKNKIAFTKRKILEAREWEPTLKMYDKAFDLVLQQLGFMYIPNRIIPGPAFIFPIRDMDGRFTCAQTKPSEGSMLSVPGMKYRYIGGKPIGPRWLGNDRSTLKKIIDLRKVMVVEGPFDLLAARLLCPDVPIMSPLTKTLGKNHVVYLRMLGVRELLLMCDNEEAKRGEKDGAGNMAMEQQVALIKTMKVTPLVCPKSDPSVCLKNSIYAAKLRSSILLEF